MVVLGEMPAECSWKTVQEQHGEEEGPLLTRVDEL